MEVVLKNQVVPGRQRPLENPPAIGMLHNRSRLCEKSKSWIADPAAPKGKHNAGPVAAQITRGCQRDALRAEGIDDPAHLYHDFASGVRDDRPGLDNCLRALRKGDILVVWKLDRLGRNLAHLVHTVQDLSARGVGLRVLAGQGAQIDTTTAPGRLVFGIFAALAEFERELIRERTMAGLKGARA